MTFIRVFVEQDRLFEKTANDASNSGIETKGFKFVDNDSDIIVNGFTSVKSTDLNFTQKSLELTNFTLQQVLNEYSIYDIVNVKCLVYNLQIEATVKKDEQTLRLEKEMIENEQDKIWLVLFNALIDNMKNNTYYEFKKLRVQKFMNERLLQSTEMSTALAIENPGTEVTEDEAVESEDTNIQAKQLQSI